MIDVLIPLMLMGVLPGGAGLGFVNWDWEISPFVLANMIGTKNSISQVPLSGLGSGMAFNQSC